MLVNLIYIIEYYHKQIACGCQLEHIQSYTDSRLNPFNAVVLPPLNPATDYKWLQTWSLPLKQPRQ